MSVVQEKYAVLCHTCTHNGQRAVTIHEYSDLNQARAMVSSAAPLMQIAAVVNVCHDSVVACCTSSAWPLLLSFSDSM